MRAACLLLLLAAAGCASSLAPEPAAGTGEGAELVAVIDAVKQAVSEAETKDVPGFPPLKSIGLTLETRVTKTAAGEVRYLVATVGGRRESETTSKLELELVPATARIKSLLPSPDLKDALAKAIQLAKAGVAEAGERDPPLRMKSIAIDLKFVVTLEGSAGAGLTVRLLPAGLSGTAAISRVTAHAVRLTYGS